MKRVRGSLRDVFREAIISGLAVVVPLIITAAVIVFLFNSIYPFLNMLSDVVVGTPAVTVIPGVLDISRETMVELLTPAVLFLFVLVVGLLVNSSRYGERAVSYFDYVMSQIPGIGSVYDSFRRMSDVMLDSDAQNFRDVKLVEFPHEGAYTLGFVTTDTPDVLSTPAGYPDMKTLFLPLAPNPVMGGHLVHLPADRVIDVDMTVEEGIQAVVTSGVAISGGGDGDGVAGLTEAQMRQLSGVERADQQMNPDGDDPYAHRRDPVRTDRPTAYDRQVEPRHADTPENLERAERADDGAAHGPRDRPAARGRTPEDRDSTDGTPEEMAGRTAAESERTNQPPASVSPADRPADEFGSGGRDEGRGPHTDRGPTSRTDGDRKTEDGSGEDQSV
ncbi:Uncharacterized membrane protein [Halogeometricum limi]|uniref:Uncharacterized membrane protein n=2 Tax=Halogeometricum limi TaxID=555875 RepID=A0A1I6I1P9_9EURY|nr:Uncharacterized membrane protein [Halogeometricum limi]